MSDLLCRGKGCVPDPKNLGAPPARDYLRDRVGGRALGPVDLRPYCPPVRDQGPTNSCVGQAFKGAREVLQRVRGEAFEDISASALYYNSRFRETKGKVADEGTSIYLCADTICELGAPLERDWPFDPATINDRPSWEALRLGFHHRMDAWFRVGETGDARLRQVRQAFAIGLPVVFGTPVTMAFERLDRDAGVQGPPDESDVVGLHAMLLVGETAEGEFWVRNSWGEGWGEDGYFRMSQAWLLDERVIDITVATVWD